MVRKDIRRTRVLGSIGIVLCIVAFIVVTLLILESPEPLSVGQENQTQEQPEENRTEESASEPDVPRQKLLYVLHNTPSMFSVVDLEKNDTIKEITLSGGPHEMFYDQGTDEIYITKKAANTISVVNREKQEIVRTIKGGSSPEGVIVTDKKIYVTNPGERVVLVINKALGSIDKEIRVGEDPSHMLLSQDQRKIYVLNRGSNDITIINTNIDAFIDTWFAGDNPGRFAINAHERFMYISSLNGLITILPMRQPKEYREMRVGLGASEIAFSPNNILAITVNSDENTISLTSLTQEMLLATVDVGINPSDVVITSNGKTAYVSNADSNSISIVDLQQKVRVAEFPIGEDPQRLLLLER